MTLFTGKLEVENIERKGKTFKIAHMTSHLGHHRVNYSELDKIDPGIYESFFIVSGISVIGCANGEGAYKFSPVLAIERLGFFLEQANEAKKPEQEEEQAIAKAALPMREDNPKKVLEQNLNLADRALFGEIFPLGKTVKLDLSLDRTTLTKQKARLQELGYEFNFANQGWFNANLENSKVNLKL